MKLSRRQFLGLTAGSVALPIMSRIAMAQAYPTRPVRILVGFAAGGSPDIAFGNLQGELGSAQPSSIDVGARLPSVYPP